MEKNKSNTTMIQMPIENQSSLNKVDLESNCHMKMKRKSTYKTNEIKCSNGHETFYTDDNDDKSCNLYDGSTSLDSSTSSVEISDENDETMKEKNYEIKSNKKRYYHQPKTPAERTQSTFRKVFTIKRKEIVK